MWDAGYVVASAEEAFEGKSMSSTMSSSSSMASTLSYCSSSSRLLAMLLLRLRLNSGRSQKDEEVGVQAMGVFACVARRWSLAMGTAWLL